VAWSMAARESVVSSSSRPASHAPKILAKVGP
jgi:hypothetical protein